MAWEEAAAAARRYPSFRALLGSRAEIANPLH
jgi:hypothetical protein